MGTKEAIKTQFMKEYMNKDFSQITVKGLCGSTPVARTTFYSYFENTSDVLEAVEDDLVKGLAEVPVKVCGGNLKEMDFKSEHFCQMCSVNLICGSPIIGI